MKRADTIVVKQARTVALYLPWRHTYQVRRQHRQVLRRGAGHPERHSHLRATLPLPPLTPLRGRRALHRELTN
eukprot:scaffold29365_cov48-Phaeocystis_antarctica.AAC.2